MYSSYVYIVRFDQNIRWGWAHVVSINFSLERRPFPQHIRSGLQLYTIYHSVEFVDAALFTMEHPN